MRTVFRGRILKNLTWVQVAASMFNNAVTMTAITLAGCVRRHGVALLIAR